MVLKINNKKKDIPIYYQGRCSKSIAFLISAKVRSNGWVFGFLHKKGTQERGLFVSVFKERKLKQKNTKTRKLC